jgi:hypothetical protein
VNDLKQKLADLNEMYNLIEINNNELEKLLENLSKLSENFNNDATVVLNKTTFNSIHDKARTLKICLALILNNTKSFTKLANKIGDEKDNTFELLKKMQ